jgi:uncharacterized membrane protein
MVYLIIKWVHILLAITALGANITYGVWIARGSRNPAHLAFVLRGVKILDDRVANPAYGLLLVTGLGMALGSGIPLTTPWLMTALILYVLLVIVGVAGYTPTLKKQVQLVEANVANANSPEYAALTRRSRILTIVLSVTVLAITFMMVVKPTLWAA